MAPLGACALSQSTSKKRQSAFVRRKRSNIRNLCERRPVADLQVSGLFISHQGDRTGDWRRGTQIDSSAGAECSSGSRCALALLSNRETISCLHRWRGRSRRATSQRSWGCFQLRRSSKTVSLAERQKTAIRWCKRAFEPRWKMTCTLRHSILPGDSVGGVFASVCLKKRPSSSCSGRK